MIDPMELETSRLRLREFSEADFATTHAYAADADTTRYTLFGPNTEDDTREFLLRTIAHQKEDPRVDVGLAIELKSPLRHIGGIGFRVRRNRSADFGYVLHRDFWGKGYTTEAARALLHYGFDALKLHRIIATCDPANAASRRVLEKLGMRHEGTFVKDSLMKGEWRNSLLYAILEEEWRG